MKKNIILSAALMLFTLIAQAQTTTITFDGAEADYEALRVYDSWEESPFRAAEPVIDYEAEVVDNPYKGIDEALGEAPNPSEKVVKLRRSRYGSNTFGLRIDLKEPIRVTKQLQYIHIMTYLGEKPADSRMMVIGLGNRLEESWNWQTGEDEQFWAVTTTDVKPKAGWQDVVVSFKGFSEAGSNESGIDIHSLVIVPDVRSPHADAEDWYAYIDEIVVDNNPSKRFIAEKYALSVEKEATLSRNDRYLNKVGLTVGDKTYESSSRGGKKFYTDNTALSVFSAKAGDEVQPTFNYTGGQMSGYVYVDWNNDGRFEYTVNDDGTPATGSDIVSYGAAQVGGTWRNSKGETKSGGNALGNAIPKFTIPQGTEPGFYRMRYKVDWNSLDPAGNAAANNLIVNNGGGIVDVILEVAGEKVIVKGGQRNGDILLASNDNKLDNHPVTYGQTLTIKLAPENGFVQYGFNLKYGYKVDATEQLDDNGNPNYIAVNVPYSVIAGDGTYEIPAEYLRGSHVAIEGIMESVQTYTVNVVGLEEGQGGVVYANIETTHGGTVKATQFFSAEQVQPIVVENYDATISINDRVITVTYTFAAKPYRDVTSLSELKNYKLYQIKNKNDRGYLAWNTNITDTNLSIRGVTNFGSGEPSDANIRAQYAEAVSPFDVNTVWQIIEEDGKYYLYHPARKAYVTRNDRDYQFTDAKTALDGIRVNGDGTFSFHAGGGYSDTSKDFACIVTNEPSTAVRDWTWNDQGSVMQIIENPNVYTLEYTVEITGHSDGAIVYDGTNYANGSTLTTTEFFTAEDVEVKTVGLYSSAVTLDKENHKITVRYIPPKVVTAINPEMFYTLECRSGVQHNTTRFVGDNGTVIDGRSAEPTFLMFEPGDVEGTYYIKSVVSGKYINSDGTNLSASKTKSTAWTFGVGGKNNVANVVTFGLSGDKYLNNNGTKCSDGSVVNLQPNKHDGGPESGNACSLWQMCEFEPNNYQVAILGDNAATVTFNGLQYANGTTIKTLEIIQHDDIVATEVAGKVTIVNVEGTTIYVSYFDATTQFYTIRHNGGGYVSLHAAYTDGNGNLKLDTHTEVANTQGLWAFDTQAEGGFKIYNLATGLHKVLGMTGSAGGARASMVPYNSDTHTTTFYGTLNLQSNEASFIRMASTGNNYWNYRDGFLALWNNTSAGSGDGSKFFMSPVDYGNFFAPEAVSIGEHEIATFYANISARIPDGVEAYVATAQPEMNDGEGIIRMTKIEDGIIPAQTGVVLCGAQGDYSFIYTAAAGTPVTGNLLRGYAGAAAYADVAFPTDGSTNYVLTVENEEAGFYRKEAAFKVYNHKAYLNIPATETPVNALRIRFAGGTPTEIEGSELKAQGSQLIYDLQGRRVLNPTKGVYIVNGKKVIVK